MRRNLCALSSAMPLVVLLLALLAQPGHALFGWGEKSAPAPGPIDTTLRLHATVTDTLFVVGDSLRIEVIETGAAVVARRGETFLLELPLDTSWHLCVTQGERERCYLFEDASGQRDLQFQLGGGPAPEPLFTPTDSLVKVAVDSAVVEELPEEAEQSDEVASEGTTRLQKVSVRLKKRPKRALGQSVVTTKKIKRMPGLAEADVIRAIQALPGVVASSDFSTKIYVRGGSADQNLFLFDKAVVYSPVHFFGLFSTFLVEGIDEVQFF